MPVAENPITFVRSIKGAPASVLLTLLCTREPMSNEALQRWTGYSDETITKATRLLVEMGWIVARGQWGPWSLDSGRRFPAADILPRASAGDGEPSDNSGSPSDISGSPSAFLSAARPDITGAPSDISGSPSGFAGAPSDISGTPSDNFGASSRSRSLDLENLDSLNLDLEASSLDLDLEASSLDLEAPNPEQEDSGVETDTEPELEHAGFAELLRALKSAGINEPAASRLARLPHVTPELIRQQVQQARLDHRPLGSAIYRIEFGWGRRHEPPRKMSELERQHDVEEKIRRFLEHK